MKTQNQVVDLSDLLVTQDEALDLLGDLLVEDPSKTSLFGGKPVKISKPRPQWQVDGAIVVHSQCMCKSCATAHEFINPKLLLSMSYVDHEGNVLKSVKTSDYNLLLEVKGGPFFGKKNIPEHLDPIDFTHKITHEILRMEDVDFCSECLRGIYREEDLREQMVKIIQNQHATEVRKKENDTAPNKEFRNKLDKERAEAAEQRLMDYMDSLEQNRPTVIGDVSDNDLPY